MSSKTKGTKATNVIKAKEQLSKKTDIRYETYLPSLYPFFTYIQFSLSYIGIHTLSPPVNQFDRLQVSPIINQEYSSEIGTSATLGDGDIDKIVDSLTDIDSQACNMHRLAYVCPYHGPILNFCKLPTETQGQSPMERFLAEDDTDRSSFLIGSGGQTSPYKGCTCWNNINDSIQTSVDPSTSVLRYKGS
jgi:hypothetical protein